MLPESPCQRSHASQIVPESSLHILACWAQPRRVPCWLFYTWTTNDLESATFRCYVGLVGTLLRMKCSQILTKHRQRNRTWCHELARGSCTGMWGLSWLALSHFKVYECGVPKFQTPRRKGVQYKPYRLHKKKVYAQWAMLITEGEFYIGVGKVPYHALTLEAGPIQHAFLFVSYDAHSLYTLGNL